jgi:hypothetical protein
MALLRADLRALANLPTTSAGRRVAIGTLLGLGLLALMWWSVASTMMRHPQLLPMLHQATGGNSLHGLLGIGLMPCAIAASWLGLSLAQRQLFETPELLLWRTAPIPGWRAAVQVLLRACFLTLLWASALAVPFVVTLLRASPAGWLAYLLLPLAILCCTVPLLATLLAVQIVLVRFFAGRLLRIVLAVVAALASVLFSTWLLLGLFAPEQARLQAVATMPGGPDRLPWTIETAASLLASAANGTLDTAALRGALGWLGLAVSLFWFAAKLHPRAVEKHLEAQAPLLRRRRSRWPTGIAANVRKKEFAQVLQQPGALIGFLVFAVLVFALASERVLVGGLLNDSRLPRDLAHTAAMAVLWFLAVLLVLYAHMGRLALWDGPQWSLYTGSPAAPRAILRGKLEAVLVFLLWPLVLVAGAGAHLFSASLTAVASFVGIALGGTLAALGVLAVVGTSPRLMRPDDGGHIVQGGRSFLAALLLVLLFQLAMSPAMFGWMHVIDHLRTHRIRPETVHAWAPWVVGAAVLHGLSVGGLGIALGVRNYRRLTAPSR